MQNKMFEITAHLYFDKLFIKLYMQYDQVSR